MGKKSPIGSIADSFETITDPVSELGREFKKTVVNDLGKQSANEFFSQLLGISVGGEKKASAESSAPTKANGGEIFNIATLQKSADKKPAATVKDRMIAKPERRAAAIEYFDYHKEIVNAEKNASRKEMNEMNSRIQQIQNELQKLISTSRELQMEFGGFVVQQAPKDSGKYYLNFFEWLLIVIRTARQKVENSKAWMGTIQGKGKKGKKADYWDMYKEHGTSFGLSNERFVATQTG